MKIIKIKEILIPIDKIVYICGGKNKIDFMLMGNEEIIITTKNFSVEHLLNLMSITEGDVIDLTDITEKII
jgi:hypothetical protein